MFICKKEAGFTLLELVSVIVLLGVLAAIAVPRYHNYKETAELAVIKATLGNVRTAIHNFYLNTAVTETEPRYPTLTELTTKGVVLQESIPENPYKGNNDVGSYTAARVIGGSHGWLYNSLNGDFWLNQEGFIDL